MICKYEETENKHFFQKKFLIYTADMLSFLVYFFNRIFSIV